MKNWPEPAFEALSEAGKAHVLRLAGPAFWSAPTWAQNWFARTVFCPWGCGMRMVFHYPGDQVCERRQVERYENQPPGASLVYFPQEWADRLVADLGRDAVADAGDGYVKVRTRVTSPDGSVVVIGSH